MRPVSAGPLRKRQRLKVKAAVPPVVSANPYCCSFPSVKSICIAALFLPWKAARLRAAPRLILALRSAPCALRSVPCALLFVLCALCSVLCALRPALCSLCFALCALCSVLCALRSALCAFPSVESSPLAGCAQTNSGPALCALRFALCALCSALCALCFSFRGKQPACGLRPD